MKTRRTGLWAVLLLLALIAAAPAAHAAVNALGLEGWAVTGGGGASSAGVYTLNATIGQAGAGSLQGGVYTLQGGFQAGGGELKRYLFLPVLKK